MDDALSAGQPTPCGQMAMTGRPRRPRPFTAASRSELSPMTASTTLGAKCVTSCSASSQVNAACAVHPVAPSSMTSGDGLPTTSTCVPLRSIPWAGVVTPKPDETCCATSLATVRAMLMTPEVDVTSSDTPLLVATCLLYTSP